jgi:histidinol phosphatase-like enzyme (inositol monophosphatase family)
VSSADSTGITAHVDLTPYRDFLPELAAASADCIRPFFANPDLVVETKSDATPVTAADRGAEEVLRRLIKAKFPAHGIVGEEHGSENPDAEFVWVLDPIDGTKSFITGVPLWGTLIALLHQGQPVLGCINQPILGQQMIGDGTTTTLNGRPVRTRATTRLADATFLTSDPFNYRQRLSAGANDLLARAKLVRTWGDCYGYLLVAAGLADIMIDPIMNPWDIAALVPVIRGAGGVITDTKGNTPYPAENTVACATPELHAEVLAGLKL